VEQRFVQEQILQRKMNQTLIQSVQLLQYASADLVDYLKKVAEENPLIASIDYGEDFPTFQTNQSSQEIIDDIGEMNETKLSMNERLKEDLYMVDVEEHLRPVVQYGIDCINEDGYLYTSLEEWAEDCSVTIQEVEESLALIQSLEPAGIGARSLAECIFLQLKHTPFYNQTIQQLLADDLNLIATENILVMMKDYLLTEEEAVELIEAIKQCHPKPGQLIADVRTEYIYPEADVRVNDGQLEVMFYKSSQPTIVIDDSYKYLLQTEKEVHTYLKEKYEQIHMLQRALAFRTTTLELVIQTMVHMQQDYFLRGPKYMKPLVLREVAEKVDRHVSTVSRTISQKYIQTEEGIIPLNTLLQSRLKNKAGHEVSALTVKHYMLQLINREQKDKPLSDEAIRKQLQEMYDIQVARRTIMKYRDELNILSSVKRKQVRK